MEWTQLPENPNRSLMMKRYPHLIRVFGAVAALAITIPTLHLVAADSGQPEKDGPIAVVMQKYHKAPKGVDPVCKRAIEGKATQDELKHLVEAYKIMAKSKPPHGDDASWKEKTALLIATSEALLKGSPDAAAKFKEAVNCKACHSAHKPEKH